MIELVGVERVFEFGNEQVRALSEIDLRIDAGEYVSVMGPSGSG
jgi:putative ABC transport system ATP-binding protein